LEISGIVEGKGFVCWAIDDDDFVHTEGRASAESREANITVNNKIMNIRRVPRGKPRVLTQWA
jgi:hypothetical protein